ncbi:MAG: aminopeptidase P family protein [Myxococcales bacterium]|nr:aminopeptidase P family protein [Myxococcales bacterium]
MSSPLPPQSPSIYAARRQRLSERLGGAPALIVAGRPRPRNYAANLFRFRADSHFLYLVGMGLVDAVLFGHAGRWELFAHPDAPDDALWHGETASWEEIAAATGVDRVRPRAELPAAIAAAGGAAAVATLPAIELSTRVRQAALLKRPWGLHEPREAGPAPLSEVDAALADAMVELRLVHDEGALELLRIAATGTHDAHLAGMAVTRPGIGEQAVVAAIEGAMAARGMEPSYGSIVSVHGEILHNTVYTNTLADGDLLLCDAGAEHQGWASDVTRTWPVAGRFSPTQRDLYELVLAAQKEAIAGVRPGARYRDLHLLACRVIARGLVDLGILRGDPDGLVERGAHALFFPHGLGHLLGLDVHDMEDLGDRAGYAAGRARSRQFGLAYLRLDRDLAPGMLVTIEPGIYIVPAILADRELCGPFDADGTLDRARLAAFADVRGIRIEDDVLCTSGAPEVLTASIPKEADAVAAAVGVGAAASAS